MGKLINVDNGGTLTDICVIDGAMVYRTKTLTTPHDLSRCLLDGLRKASCAIYGEEDLVALLASTDHLRYSTTQGTNALVERKGPKIGRASCRERVCQYVEIAVVAVSLKKKTITKLKDAHS